ncbi:MarR family winged helix-turn-helix transcriptional regulator [Arthrobacter sp. MMS18-M83]|uniref:MarR family winged helix-turn-helix transcriptional regulator n=1 Tax=Arthrobacter sp. MMS18-M83 TaxID=2996261 RepID=UPI00227B50EC|nr:MarR family transcriptional regulator [Arthrobacter sp. MMS18-M83]WAH97754.1 MarR family transcriptional regulator [Arthrobacter sp. MMS18-M83]
MPAEDAALITQLISTTHRVTRMAATLTGEPRNSTHYRTLGLLRQFGPSRIGEIAAYERITQPGATKIVTALEAEGFVARENDPEDGRASVISITPAGNTAVEAWQEQISAVLVPRFGKFSDEDRAAIARTLMLLESSLQN